MTIEEILDLSPGRELDALVAEKVMLFNMHYSDKTLYSIDGYRSFQVVPNYSTDISAAWQVLDALKSDYLISVYTDLNGRYTAEIGPAIVDDCEDAPEPISKAALIALEIMKEETYDDTR